MKANSGFRSSFKKTKKNSLLLSKPSDSEMDKIFDCLAKSESVGGDKTDLGSVSAQNIAQVA